MKSVGLFVDVSDIYYCIGKRYPGRRLNYESYLEEVSGMGDVCHAYAYGTQLANEAQSFINLLQKLGYETKYKRPRENQHKPGEVKFIDWSVGIAMDVVRTVEKLDLVVLGSASRHLVPLIEWIKESGSESLVYACGISRELKDATDRFVEIQSSLLQIEEAPKDSLLKEQYRG